MADNGLLARLANGGNLVVAEGYLFEFERRGYLQAGSFVPEVVLKHPDLVKSLTEEFIHAGSDVALAFTYYGHREKLKLIGMEDKIESLNRKALQIAGDVARETGTLFAGNICNTTVYQPDDQESIQRAELMFKEQIEWAIEAGVDFIVAETFDIFGEAMLALESIKKYGKGVPAVVTLAATGMGTLRDGEPLEEKCRELEECGAAVVGLNCWSGPGSIMNVMKKIRQACKGPIACLPVPYRTSEEFPTMQSIIDPFTGTQAFPENLSAHKCGRAEIRQFAQECKDIGIEYVGLCCGNESHLMREVAEVYGRNPPASKYKTDMNKHFVFGDKTKFASYNQPRDIFNAAQ